MQIPADVLHRTQRAYIAKAWRIAMGKRSKEIAAILGVGQGNYSKMERGLEVYSEERYDKMREMFIEWRAAEIARLQKQIEYLNSLTDEKEP